MMPYPFSRGVFVCGSALHVSRNADAEEMEDVRKKLEKSLNDITDRADNFFTKTH